MKRRRRGSESAAGWGAAVALLALASHPAGAAFTPEQVDLIINADADRGPNSPKGLKGAELNSQYFYHYFKKDRDPGLVPPAWVDETLDAMVNHKVWRDPEEGELSEAHLWQAPASVLYEFFQHTRKTFPPDKGGMFVPPANLIREYEDSRTRFQMALDRLYRARLGDSLGGRGRSVMAVFNLILMEMNTLLDSLTSQDPGRYAESVVAVAALTNNAFLILHSPPRGWSPAPSKRPAKDPIGKVMGLLGMILFFAFAWSLGAMNADRLDTHWQDFIKRSKEWAQEFNRQFVQIKVQYLVIVPAAVGVLLGIATLNIFGFILMALAGAYIGYNAPRWLLGFIRYRRGKRVEAQLMDGMILLSNALKSGLDIVQGFELVSRDLVPPISEEFGLVIKNYQLGTPFEKALEGMEERIASRLLSYVIKAIVIQRSVGGNLTKIFDRIVDNIREEAKLEEKMQSLTAQQRIQSIVVGIMPWAMVVLMFIFQPETMSAYYFSPLGVLTVMFCVIWMSIGMGIVRKLADIQV